MGWFEVNDFIAFFILMVLAWYLKGIELELTRLRQAVEKGGLK